MRVGRGGVIGRGERNVDFVLRRLDLLHNWFGDHVRVHPDGDGERISCLLTGRLAELRMAGHTWPQVAAAVGAGAEACRKQLARALDHVVQHLGLEDDPL